MESRIRAFDWYESDGLGWLRTA